MHALMGVSHLYPGQVLLQHMEDPHEDQLDF